MSKLLSALIATAFAATASADPARAHPPRQPQRPRGKRRPPATLARATAHAKLFRTATEDKGHTQRAGEAAASQRHGHVGRSEKARQDASATTVKK